MRRTNHAIRTGASPSLPSPGPLRPYLHGVASLCNFGHADRKVMLMRNGKPVRGTNMDGTPVGPVLTLRPLSPLLITIRE